MPKQPSLTKSVSLNKHFPPQEVRGFTTLLKVAQRTALSQIFLEVFINLARQCSGSVMTPAGNHIIELIPSINIDNNKGD